MATLKDIASRLGISTMAVSKALRDAPDISQSTKSKVRETARAIGYVRDLNASSLRGGRSRLTGCLVPEINEPATAGMIRGIEQAASESGMHLLVAASHHNAQRELILFEEFCQRKVEALFLQPVLEFQHRSLVLEAVQRLGCPLIFLDEFPADAVSFQGVGWVVPDAFEAGRKATEYCLDLGHREILYFSGPPTASSAAAHHSGFKKALREANLPYVEKHVFLAGATIASGTETMVRALEENLSFTAVICINDTVALGAIDLLTRQGVQVPDDVSVIGFGDGILAQYAKIPLTTVRRPQVELGRQAWALWKNRQPWTMETLEPKIIPVELITRSSTTPPTNA